MVEIAASHRRRLDALWRRLQRQGREDASLMARRELRGVISPNGQVRGRALPAAGGDVVGPQDDLEVIGITHLPIEDSPPSDGQGLVFRASDGVLHWVAGGTGAGGTGGCCEPIVADDADTTEGFMWENGDILVDG